jgi:hypothetical protein
MKKELARVKNLHTRKVRYDLSRIVGYKLMLPLGVLGPLKRTSAYKEAAVTVMAGRSQATASTRTDRRHVPRLPVELKAMILDHLPSTRGLLKAAGMNRDWRALVIEKIRNRGTITISACNQVDESGDRALVCRKAAHVQSALELLAGETLDIVIRPRGWIDSDTTSVLEAVECAVGAAGQWNSLFYQDDEEPGYKEWKHKEEEKLRDLLIYAVTRAPLKALTVFSMSGSVGHGLMDNLPMKSLREVIIDSAWSVKLLPYLPHLEVNGKHDADMFKLHKDISVSICYGMVTQEVLLRIAPFLKAAAINVSPAVRHNPFDRIPQTSFPKLEFLELTTEKRTAYPVLPPSHSIRAPCLQQVIVWGGAIRLPLLFHSPRLSKLDLRCDYIKNEDIDAALLEIFDDPFVRPKELGLLPGTPQGFKRLLEKLDFVQCLTLYQVVRRGREPDAEYFSGLAGSAGSPPVCPRLGYLEVSYTTKSTGASCWRKDDESEDEDALDGVGPLDWAERTAEARVQAGFAKIQYLDSIDDT